jgi:hypothetical protein
MAALAALLDWLSGNVPGGLLPYFFFLLLVNLTTFYLGKHSGLMRWSNVRRKLLYFNLLFVVFYVSIRIASAPGSCRRDYWYFQVRVKMILCICSCPYLSART